MSDRWPCPNCDAVVPGTGLSGRIGIGATAQPARQHGKCPGCGAGLVRSPEGADPAWRIDLADDSAPQLRLRLEAAAREHGLEFEGPRDPDPVVWRFYLNEPLDPARPNDRTARVVGTGPDEHEALVEAIYDAETKGLL